VLYTTPVTRGIYILANPNAKNALTHPRTLPNNGHKHPVYTLLHPSPSFLDSLLLSYNIVPTRSPNKPSAPCSLPHLPALQDLVPSHSENQMPNPIPHHHPRYYHPRELEYRDFIPRRSHARQPRCAALERRAERGEGGGLVQTGVSESVHGMRSSGRGRKGKGEVVGEATYSTVNNMLIARVVVDVYRHAAQRGDFGGEFVEARVVLSTLVC
jgi:hypothetical protein